MHVIIINIIFFYVFKKVNICNFIYERFLFKRNIVIFLNYFKIFIHNVNGNSLIKDILNLILFIGMWFDCSVSYTRSIFFV